MFVEECSRESPDYLAFWDDALMQIAQHLSTTRTSLTEKMESFKSAMQ